MDRTDGGLTPLRKALLSIEKLQGRVRALESERAQPIAVVGIGCRIPGGADDPDSFFEALKAGKDAICEQPPVDRPGWPRDAVLPPAGYLDADPRAFDAAFFGISPREAASIDPQHRLLLECAWEALEHAGMDPHSLAGTRAGVFLGMAGNDYANMQLRSERMEQLLHSHFASGTGHSMASGRLSYLLGLHGPSLTVDTACSSSLVAVHLACQSLRNGESELAFAAGVNLILSTEYTTAFDQARMLAPDGRCKTFDAAADGFSRAEGCGVLILKRLADAQRDGDRILALIRGSAVNQDGPSSGLTAPNGPAQEAVIRAALSHARLEPADIAYVEAHGTGTSLGDPIEVQALGAVFNDRPEGQPLLIGSVKTNVGHLEAAAGVTGLIKVIASLRNRTIPPTLHFRTPNPHIPWAELDLAVNTDAVPFPALNGARRAGVSSFGFSGTNAHVIVEEAPESAARDSAPDRVRVVTLSAADQTALREHAGRMRAHIDASTDAFVDVCATATAGRAHLPHRLAVCARDASAAVASIDAWLRGEETGRSVHVGHAGSEPPALAFLFTGQGAQYAGMGWSLREQSPVVRRVLGECDEILRAHLDVPLLSVLDPAGANAHLIDRTDLTQPAIFAVQVALAELWRSWGVKPSVVLGHSIGEYAAAYLAGVFTLEDALRVVAARGRLMQAAGEAGRMIAVMADEERVREWVDAAGGVSIAAINAPSQIVVSGTGDGVGAVEAAALAAGVQVKALRTSQAFHSPIMDGVVPELEKVLRTIPLKPASRVRFISTVTGAPVAPGTLADPTYWSTQVRLPVRYADAVSAAATMVPRAIEVGPHPTLAGLAALGGVTMPVHASLQRDQDAWETLMTSVAALYVNGVPFTWSALEPDVETRRVDLPRYPFQRQPLWVDTGSGTGVRRRGGHPLLGARAPQPGSDVVFDGVLQPDAPPFIAEHRVLGQAILPGTAFVEMGLAAGREALGGAVELQDVELLEPMRFDDADKRLVHTRVDTRAGTFEIHSTIEAAGAEQWTLHCTGRVLRAGDTVPRVDLDGARSRCDRQLSGAEFAAGMAARGYDFGPRLRGVVSIDAGDGVAVSRVALPEECTDDVGGYVAHPLLLDAAVQTVGAAMCAADAGRTWVPLSIARVSLGGTVNADVVVHATVQPAEAKTLRASVALTDGAGNVLASLEGMTFRELTRSQLARNPFLETKWVEVGELSGAAQQHRAETASAAVTSLADLARVEDAAAYDRFVDTLEARSAELTVRAFRDLGWNPQPGSLIDVGTLAGELGVIESRRRLFARMLEILGEEGVIERTEGGWRVLGDLPAIERTGIADLPLPERVADAAQHPPAERVLLERCGPELANLLRGIGDPLELLFPAGAADDAEKMYYDAPFARIFNRTIADVVAAAAAAVQGRELRVLEVGGGTAGTTRRILERLDAEGLRVQYTFTDVSPLFLERGRRRWADRTDIEYRTFDLDRDVEDQGLATSSYDIVIAANCLHAARDLGAALRRVRSLLRSGGMLAAVEVFAPHRWFDLTVGLTDGWWHFTDSDLRPSYPCIGPDTWLATLSDAGFAGGRALPLGGGDHGFASRSQGIVLAWRGAAPARGSSWLVAGSGALAENTAAELSARGADVQHAGDDFRGALRRRAEWDGVVLCEPASAGRSLQLDRVQDAVRAGIEPVIALAADVAAGTVSVDRLAIVTRGAQMVVPSDFDVDASSATVWGTARALELELPELTVQRLDLAATPSRDDIDLVVNWLVDAAAEPELAARFDRLHARRLVPASPVANPLPGEYRLKPPATGSLDDLAFEDGERRAPGAGEVEVRVLASGVNFKDVLSVLGMYPGDAGPLGSESAGIVTAVGPGVSLAIGDHVMVAAGHGYGRHVVSDARMVARKPESLTFAQAASLPIAYLTAYFALEHLAGLRAGERVLIHAAAGGVGMAAVALAQRAGAEVFATAGSDEKRALLREMGVQHVFDSRSDAFAQDILAATQGAGVHVVLNSLADELIDRTFDVIASGGRFLEIGKRGIWSHERVAALGRDIAYHIIDWGETQRQNPELVGRLYAEVMAMVARSELPPLPVTTFALERAADAFRYMAAGRHIGKIVLLHPVLADVEPIRFDHDGAYVITGGTGGLGLSTAQWAVEQGARELVLVSRRGAGDNAAAIDALRETGTRVHVIAGDIGTADGVASVVAKLRAEGITRVAGIVHSAGALVNRTLQQATWEDFDAVLRAKVYGTSLLQEALAPFGPRFFLCYSSIASVFGAPGQANHSAANAFQDAFAATRVLHGQTGMSISWGPWSETGAAARADVLDRTRDLGLVALTTREGLAWLEYACAQPAAHLVGARIDDPSALDRGNRPLFAELRRTVRRVEERAAAVAAPAASRFVDELEAAPVDARRGVLLNRIRMRIRRVLGLAQNAALDSDRPLGEIGLDSLLAVELRNVLAEDIGQRLPATLLFDHATPAALADHLHTLTAPAATEAVAAPVNDSPVGLVGVLESLDDDDVDRLLAEKLKQS